MPLVTGACYVKWHLPSSTAVEHRGKTHRAPIKDHLVTWDYETRVELRMIVDKKGELEAADIQFEIVQDYAVGAKGERALLGVVRLNLAEYVLACDEMEEAVCRRYLMQESKINSTVKVCTNRRATERELIGLTLLQDIHLHPADRRGQELRGVSAPLKQPRERRLT